MASSPYHLIKVGVYFFEGILCISEIYYEIEIRYYWFSDENPKRMKNLIDIDIYRRDSCNFTDTNILRDLPSS